MIYHKIISNKPLDLAPVTEEWFAWYHTRLMCSECGLPRRGWALNPKPIQIRLTQEPKRTIHGLEAGPSCELVHESLALLLLPFVPSAVLHEVVVVGNSGRLRKKSEYIAATAPRDDQVDPNRGPYCRHDLCPGCEIALNYNFRSYNGILQRYAKGRRVFMDAYGSFFVDAELADKIRSNKRFTDVRFIEYETIPEPLDGDVLPGDPEWSGKFVKRPCPTFEELPKSRKERKKWLT